MHKTLLTLALLLPALPATGQDHVGHAAEQCPNKPGPCPNKPKPEPAPEPAPARPKPHPLGLGDDEFLAVLIVAGLFGVWLVYKGLRESQKP